MGFRGSAFWVGLGSVLVLAGGCSSGGDEGAQGRKTGSASGISTRVRSAGTAAGSASTPAATANALRQQLGGARTLVRGDVQRRVFGPALATGKTPVDAAKQFSAKLASVLGVPAADLEAQELVAGEAVAAAAPQGMGLMYDAKTGQYRYRLFRFGQRQNGLEVVDSELLALVKQGGNNPVVWGASRLRGLNGFRAKAARVRTPDPDKTLRALRSNSNFVGASGAQPTSLAQLGAAKLVVYAGRGERLEAPRTALSYVVETASPYGKWRVLADETTLDVISAESLVHSENVQGTVVGLATSGVKAADCAEEVSTPLPFAEITGSAGSAFADVAGAFTFLNAGTDPVTLSSLPGGQFFDVVDMAQPSEVLSQSVTPPGPASFVHNPLNATELLRAEANGYVESNQVRQFLLGYLPSYPTIATQLNFPVNVNRNDVLCPGNAWYDGVSINFCRATTSTANTSFGSVNHHEYGHHIVEMGGSGQAAYGEGMSDTIAALLAKDPGLGYGFNLNACSTPLRTALNNCQYSASSCSSCGSESHACGNLISGTVWSIREALKTTEPENHDEVLRPLVLSSIPMHSGTSIDGSIAVDLLTLDDDDADIGNGTPHYAEICSGFSAHGMQCPPVLVGLQVVSTETLSSSGPVGGPFEPASVAYSIKNYGPVANLTYQVSSVAPAPWLSLTNATGQLALGQEATVTASIDQAAAASLPKGSYLATLNFVNSTDGTGGGTRPVALEVGAPSVVFLEPFNAGLGGFTLDAEPTNQWHVSSACAATNSGHSAPNALFFGTDAGCNFDTGARTLGSVTSPEIAISDPSKVLVSLNYLLGTEGGTTFDKASILASINGGEFVLVAKNGTTTDLLQHNTGVWQKLELDLSSQFPQGAPAKLRLRASFDSVDSVANTGAGFWIDDVQVRAFVEACTSPQDCNDGQFCNGVEQCVNGACTAGTAVLCNDNVACTVDACDETADACTSAPNNAACNDGNVCNGTETCSATGCVAGTPLVCDDGNVCTTDTCNATLGCQLTNNTANCADDGNACTSDVCSAGQCTHPSNGSCSSGPFLESGGTVVMEAEHFTTNTARASHNWSVTADGAAAGGQVMRSLPNNGANINTGYTSGSPQLDFPIMFTTTGTYQVWLRGYAATGDDDSAHVGLDGQGPASSDRISTFGTSLGWTKATMDGPVATIVVSTPGLHTLNLWMREDGLSVDRLLLTTNASFTPSGAGPAESSRGSGGCSSAADCNDGNPCTTDACNSGTCTYSNNTATCPDDGSACTNDVCSAGVCTHPQNGTCGGTPCSAFCAAPVVYSTSNFQSGNLGTNATCHQTTATLNGGNCGNFVSPRTLSVNGTVMSCNNGNWSSLPAPVNGGYCIQTTAGNQPWAYFTTW
jgi:hypothetical protein